VKLYDEIGESEKARKWEAEATLIKDAIRKIAWNEQEDLFADYPGKSVFSQHTNIMAILCNVVQPSKQKEHLMRILNYKEFDEMASSYFSFFLFKAMQKTGQEDLFLDNLDFWYNFIDRGHTTTGETGFASHDRSDCHAWSAHPGYYLLSMVAGIEPADVGFNTVKISPHIGELSQLEVSVPHPRGKIKVNYQLKRGKLSAEIELPKGMTGEWEFKQQKTRLHEGINRIN